MIMTNMYIFLLYIETMMDELKQCKHAFRENKQLQGPCPHNPLILYFQDKTNRNRLYLIVCTLMIYLFIYNLIFEKSFHSHIRIYCSNKLTLIIYTLILYLILP